MLNPEDISLELLNELKKLEPYGLANPPPIFMSENLIICDCRAVGIEGAHLKMKLGFGSKVFDAIGFKMGPKYASINSKISDSGSIDVVYALEENSWGNTSVLELNLKDIKSHGIEN